MVTMPFLMRFLSTPSARRATDLVIGNTPFQLFLSTPSARRATVGVPQHVGMQGISIHALREEGDLLRVKSSKSSSYFYPRPPRGGRRSRLFRVPAPGMISIHALREEGD